MKMSKERCKSTIYFYKPVIHFLNKPFYQLISVYNKISNNLKISNIFKISAIVCSRKMSFIMRAISIDKKIIILI